VYGATPDLQPNVLDGDEAFELLRQLLRLDDEIVRHGGSAQR
jgi:hypothetical protein